MAILPTIRTTNIKINPKGENTQQRQKSTSQSQNRTRKTTIKTEFYFSILKHDKKNHNKDRNLLLNPKDEKNHNKYKNLLLNLRVGREKNYLLL